MPTFKVFEDAQKEEVKQDAKTRIISSFPYKEFKLSAAEGGLVADNPVGGKVYLPDSAISYFDTVYRDNMENKDNFAKYLSVIDELLQSQDLADKTKKLKEMCRWFAQIDQDGDAHSFFGYIINDDSVKKEDMKKLHIFYSNNGNVQLDETLRKPYNSAVNNALYYLKFLIGMFTVLD